MPRKGGNISLSSYDDIFSTEESREAAAREQIQQIPIADLHPFEGHPFRVVDDEAMTRTVESISQFGVISPLLARPDPDGGYEIISGHRRCHAAEQVGLETLPVIVREMDDDEAIIAMVDSNLQRETILPSERAWAYKMKLDAIKHQGNRADLTLCQVGTKLRSDEKVAEGTPDSARTVQRYIRLTNLIPELMDMVDEKKIAFNPAVELSYLTREEQSQLPVSATERQRNCSFPRMTRIILRIPSSSSTMRIFLSCMKSIVSLCLSNIIYTIINVHNPDLDKLKVQGT